MKNTKKIIAIGIGCRKECFVAEIIELIHMAMEKAGIIITDIQFIATAWVKEGNEAIVNAAYALDLPLLVISKEKCDEVSGLAETVSEKVIELFSVPSVAEVSALAAAGKNPHLICSRINSASATCAVAIGER